MVNTDAGYYEVYVPVWDPQNKDNPPVNLTLDIYSDSDELDELNSDLEETLQNYGRNLSETPDQEEFIQGCLSELLDRGLLMDALCDDFNINSVEDLESRLDDSDFELFPL